MSKQCTTHHFACDCREEKFKALERENAALNHALNIAQTELRLNGCAKAADEVAKLHDAARKEAQP